MPLKLSFSAFGPYVKKQEIDFTLLKDHSLLLICGQTGAGKTVIIDAITYALYGKSSTNMRGDISLMRSQLAKSNDATELEFIFEIRGRIFKFCRQIKFARTRLNITQAAFYFDDDKFIPFFENPKQSDLEKKAEEITGLTYEQFRQVIILPQGQFERLLVAKSDEKEKILVSLFSAEKWQKAADILNSSLNEQKRDLDLKRLKIENSLNEHNAENILQLEENLLAKKKLFSEKNDEYLALLDYLKKKRLEYENETLVLNDFLSLDDANKRLKKLEEASQEADAANKKIEKNELAKRILPIYEKLKDASKDKKSRLAAFEAANSAFVAAQNESFASLSKLTEINELLPKNEEDKKRLVSLEAMREAYKKLEEVLASLLETENLLKSSATDVEQKSKQLINLSNARLELLSRQTKLFNEHTELFNAYISGISGALAQKLIDGSACPVCGSTKHPSPAKIIGASVSEEEIKLKKSELDAVNKKLKIAEHDLKEHEEALEGLRETLNAVALKKEALSAKKESLLGLVDEHIGSEKRLEIAIANLKSKIDEFNKNLEELKLKSEKIASFFAAASESLKIAEKELQNSNAVYDDAFELFNQKINEQGFTSPHEYAACLMDEKTETVLLEKLKKYTLDIKMAQASANEFSKKTSGKSRPEISALKTKLDLTEEKSISLSGEIAVLKEDISSIDTLMKRIKDEIKWLKVKEAENSQDIVFARQIRGDRGISLQRYVLGVMLDAVIAEANRLLLNVHNSRYQLFKSLEASGRAHKSGLELEVFDSMSGEKRSVTSLSGGEKFLVALSLSLGLSSVVQAQSGGIRLDAMFIDEGFGTLDPSSITDALSVLSSIKSNNGLVSIISHVEELKESIPAKIEVLKNIEGSELRLKF